MANKSATASSPTDPKSVTNAPTNPPNAKTGSSTVNSVTPDNAIARNTSPSEVLLLYGLLMMIIGALAFQASGYERKAKSALYMGNGSALLSFLLAIGVRNYGKIDKHQPGFKLVMASVHLALIKTLVLCGVVGWRLSLAWNNPAKAYLAPYLVAIIAVSATTFAALAAFKPKKQRGNAELADTQSSITNDAPRSDSSSPPTADESPAHNSRQTSDATPTSNAADAARSTDDYKPSTTAHVKTHKQHVVRRRPRRAQAI